MQPCLGPRRHCSTAALAVVLRTFRRHRSRRPNFHLANQRPRRKKHSRPAQAGIHPRRRHTDALRRCPDAHCRHSDARRRRYGAHRRHSDARRRLTDASVKASPPRAHIIIASCSPRPLHGTLHGVTALRPEYRYISAARPPPRDESRSGNTASPVRASQRPARWRTTPPPSAGLGSLRHPTAALAAGAPFGQSGPIFGPTWLTGQSGPTLNQWGVQSRPAPASTPASTPR